MKSSTEERLVKAWRNSLLAGMATIAKSPTQLDEAIKELNKSLKELGIELTDEERKEARDIAIQERDKLEEFLASLAKVLEKERIKEFKMEKDLFFEERVKDLRKKMELREKGEIKAKQIEPIDAERKIEKFIDRVLSVFEKSVEVEKDAGYMIEENFVPDPLLTVEEWGKAMKRLEKMDFVIVGSGYEPVSWMKVRFYKDKKLSLKEKVETLRKKLRLSNRSKEEAEHQKREEKIKMFIDSVVEKFEKDFEKDSTIGNSVSKIIKEFSITSFTEAELKEIKEEFEKLGFNWERFTSKEGENYIKVYLGEYEHPTTKGGGFDPI